MYYRRSISDASPDAKRTYNGAYAMPAMAGVVTLGDLAIGIRAQEAAIVAVLKAGSEEAYAWLIGEFQQPIYSLVYRMVSDPADAADTVQEVFLKVFRGMKHFHGESSLKTWIYRIALHEASNRRRWWFRHKSRESSIEPGKDGSGTASLAIKDSLADDAQSPFDRIAQEEVRARVEDELRKVPEPYRTTVILRDLEEKKKGVVQKHNITSGDKVKITDGVFVNFNALTACSPFLYKTVKQFTGPAPQVEDR